LLGGPQAGLLVGRAGLVRRCANHPLARALRLDKLRLAALVTTLEQHARGDTGSIPVWSALTTDPEALQARTDALAAAVGATVIPSVTMLGGGAAPEQGIPTPVARLTTAHPEDLAAALRRGQPPVIVRIADGAVLVDLRTVMPDEDAVIVARLREHSP
jgi:L-seryl-tRNA(Ser) seleniumtransferase